MKVAVATLTTLMARLAPVVVQQQRSAGERQHRGPQAPVPRPEPPAKFSGESQSIRQFTFEVADFFETHYSQLPELQKVGALRGMLEGDALMAHVRWLSSVASADRTVAGALEYLKARFPITLENREGLRKLCAAQQGDLAVNAFANLLGDLYNVPGLAPISASEELKINFFLNGLNADVSSGMMQKKFATFEEALEAACEAELTLSSSGGGYGGEAELSQPGVGGERGGEVRLATLRGRGVPDDRGVPGIRAPGRGHPARAVPNYGPPVAGMHGVLNAAVSCWKCGRKGHYRIQCPG